MERVAHIFLHKVGISKLVRSVLKTLFIDPLEYSMYFAVTQGSLRECVFFLYVEKTEQMSDVFFT